MNSPYRKVSGVSLWRYFMLSVAFITLTSFYVFAGGPQSLSPAVHEALRAMSIGKATMAQEALLFAYNDAINKARLARQISDVEYQVAQEHYKNLNQDFASKAAKSANASFEVQKSKSTRSQPGTDSDYITKVDSVEQIQKMQGDYNRQVNEYLQKNQVTFADRTDWHNKLDTDFMADPGGVSQAEFERIAKINNDAYKRRKAASWEYKSRNSDAGPITQKESVEYVKEMEDFRNKKQDLIEKMVSKGGIEQGSLDEGKLIQKQAQQQKYNARIGDADARYRMDHGLSDPDNLTHDLAKTGAIREPDVTQKQARKLLGKKSGEKLSEADMKSAQQQFDAKRQKAFSAEQEIHQNAKRSMAKGIIEKTSIDTEVDEWMKKQGLVDSKTPRKHTQVAVKDAADVMKNMPIDEKRRFMDEVKEGLSRDPKTGELTPESRQIMDDLKGEMRKNLKGKVEPKKTLSDVDSAKVSDANTPKSKGSKPSKVTDIDSLKITNPDTPKVKGKLQKAGEFMTVVDVFNTGQDVIDLYEGKKTASEVLKNAAVNFTPSGQIYSVADQLDQKSRGYYDGLDGAAQANRSIQQAHVMDSGLQARKKGATKEETDALMAALRNGYPKRAEEIAQKIRDRGIDYNIPDAPDEYTVEADDTVLERTEQVAIGIKDQVVRAGGFVKDAVKNVGEIVVGSVEMIGNDSDIANAERGHDQQADSLFDRLVSKGADPIEARNAVNKFKEGSFEDLINLRKKVQKQQSQQDDLMQAMMDSADLPDEMQKWEKDVRRSSEDEEDLMSQFENTNMIGLSGFERRLNDQLVLTQRNEDIQKEDLEVLIRREQEKSMIEENKKAEKMQIIENEYGNAWRSTLDAVNAVLSQLNQEDAQKVKQKTQEAAALIAQMKSGEIDDKEFTAQLAQLESEYGNLKQQGQDGFQKIMDQMMNDQVNNLTNNSTGGSGDAVKDILSSVSADQIDQRSIVCDTTSKSGNNTPASISVDMKGGSGTASLSYSLYSVKDRVLVQVNGVTVKDTGCVGGSADIPIQVSGGDKVRVVVQPACEGSSTSWDFSVSCPKGSF